MCLHLFSHSPRFNICWPSFSKETLYYNSSSPPNSITSLHQISNLLSLIGIRYLFSHFLFNHFQFFASISWIIIPTTLRINCIAGFWQKCFSVSTKNWPLLLLKRLNGVWESEHRLSGKVLIEPQMNFVGWMLSLSMTK